MTDILAPQREVLDRFGTHAKRFALTIEQLGKRGEEIADLFVAFAPRSNEQEWARVGAVIQAYADDLTDVTEAAAMLKEDFDAYGTANNKALAAILERINHAGS